MNRIVETSVSEYLREKKENLKELIRKLHAGENPEKVKKEFKELIKDIDAKDISEIEGELIKEGMPRKEIQKLCDVHLAVLKESHGEINPGVSESHPVSILMKEHEILLKLVDDLREVALVLKEAEDTETQNEEMKHVDFIVENIKDSEKHYLREENVLFPYLEKHGITEPTAVMWNEHNETRKLKKHIYKLVDFYDSMVIQDFAKHLLEASASLFEMLSNHFYKENNVLFPAAIKVIDNTEWKDIRYQFDEVGYCCFTPDMSDVIVEKKDEVNRADSTGRISFETGELSGEEIEAIFNTLPVDITFIDKNDIVRYYSQTKDKIFMRTKAVIGRTVQKCHPQKSLHVVNRILDEFKSGNREIAEFRINLNDKYILIRYFPLRNKQDDYLGCLEVSQDISDIQKIRGEKRLL